MKNMKILNLLALAAFLFVGCSDLLDDPAPATQIDGGVIVGTEDGVEALRASMYYNVLNSFDYTTEYFIGPDAFADGLFNRSGSTRFQALNAATGSDGSVSGLSSYGSTYNLVLIANLLAEAIPDDVIDPALKSQYRGEALAVRAMAMHHLVRALGYEPGMEQGGWNAGIIIRTEPTLTLADADNRPRSTNTEVYAQIRADLTEASSLVQNSSNTAITKAYVDGLLARVELYAGNWSAASTAATTALASAASLGATLQTTSAGVAGMFDETAGAHPEALFKVVVNPDTELIGGSNVNSGLAAYTSTQWNSQIPTQRIMDLYEAGDFRLGWYGKCFNEANGTDISATCTANNDSLEIQKFNGDKGNFADDIPYMRISELYLIRAEAAAKAANSVAAGIADLNAVKTARGATAVAAGDFASLTAFEDEILDERMRELTAEGHRFFDLKRLGRNVLDRTGATKFRADSYRMLDDIGDGELAINPELVENPGYN